MANLQGRGESHEHMAQWILKKPLIEHDILVCYINYLN
jgi:hypothetical protein